MILNANILFLLLLINLGQIISLKYITIPFHVQKFDYKEDKKGLLREYLYKDIAVNIYFGTPKQKISLLAGGNFQLIYYQVKHQIL